MKYACGRIALDVPDELQDRTLYAFEQPEGDPDAGIPPDRVIVMFEELPQRVRPGDMIANIRRKMEQFPDFSASYGEGQATAGTQAASTLRVDATGGGPRILVATFRSGAFIITIRYETSRADADAVFEHVLGSVRGLVGAVKPEPGYARRRAGTLWLDLPADLACPEQYRFMSPDEHVRLMILEEPAERGVEPAFEDWIGLGDGETFGVARLRFAERVLGHLPVEEGVWLAERRDDQDEVVESTWLNTVLIRFEDGAAVRVLLVEAGNSDISDVHWPKIAASVEIAGEG